MSGCFNLGVALENGSGVEKDKARADALFKHACEGGDNSGCGAYGHSLHKNDYARRAEALKLMRKSCAGGYDWVCQRLDALGESR
jgi:TPR repeat protein